jgi:hypothetical protein
MENWSVEKEREKGIISNYAWIDDKRFIIERVCRIYLNE